MHVSTNHPWTQAHVKCLCIHMRCISTFAACNRLELYLTIITICFWLNGRTRSGSLSLSLSLSLPLSLGMDP